MEQKVIGPYAGHQIAQFRQDVATFNDEGYAITSVWTTGNVFFALVTRPKATNVVNDVYPVGMELTYETYRAISSHTGNE